VETKKEHGLLTAGLERLLQNESKIGEEYHALAEMLEGLPAGLFLDWVVIEQEAHHSLLINIIHSLKQTAQKGNADRADGVEMGRETMLCWVKRLRAKEHAVIAACRSLKSQASRENEALVDAFLDALVMDSEKHQRFLSAVEEAIENIIMNRPQ
jgi:hypothetical protein